MKYNDNGIYRDLYIKSFDTVPIGTEVDFNGTNIPDGWEEVDNVLWTNGDLTSSFDPQTVTLSDDIENYEYYEVLFKFSTSSSSTLSISTGKIKTGMITVLSLPVGTNYSRTITSMSGKDFKFGPGGSYATYGTTTLTVNNTYLIPYKIIGYKGRIRKTNQYINGGASLSSTHGTSSNNGYTQEYLNDKLVHVGPEIDNNSKTNIVLSNNLCNISLFGLFPNLSGTVESQAYNNAIIDTRNITSLYVSGDFSLLADGMLRAGKYNTYPVIGSTGTRLSINTSRVIDTSDANYVLLAFAPTGGKTIEQIKNSFMVNEGSTAQPYQPYITPSINVDGKDIYAKGQNNFYSTQEQVIGTWIDGKPIYRRVFNGTTASTTQQIATLGNIANLDTIIDIYGSLISSGGYWTNVPMYYVNPNTATTYYCVAQVDPSKNVYVLSSYTSTNVRVIVEYTKTTD